jgi:hypothetical protein
VENIYLGVLENAVPHFESLWVENGQESFFDFRKYGNWISPEYESVILVPGNGTAVLAYAVLLLDSSRSEFSPRRISRNTLLDHAIRSIQWCCRTSTYVRDPIPFVPRIMKGLEQDGNWSRDSGFRANVAGHLLLGAILLWDRLDESTRGWVRDVATGMALRKRSRYFFRPEEGGSHDLIEQDLNSTLAAAFFFRDHPDHGRFMDMVEWAGLDIVAMAGDSASSGFLRGKPVKNDFAGWNLYGDGSSDHHGRAHVWYGIYSIFEARICAELYAVLSRSSLPETYTYQGNHFQDILGWAKDLFQCDGSLAHPHGVEYDSYGGEDGVLAFAAGSLILGDPVCSLLEPVSAGLLQRHAAAFPQYDFHRNAYATASEAYLVHRFLDPNRQNGSPADRGAGMQGCTFYPSQNCLIDHSGPAWVSFSWGSQTGYGNGFCGFVNPRNGCRTLPFDSVVAPLLYFHENSLTGAVNEGRIRKTWGDLQNALHNTRFARFLKKALRGSFKDSLSGEPMLAAPIQEKDQVLHAYPYTFEKTDEGFSTAGARKPSGKGLARYDFVQKQAFFSFDQGLCANFIRIEACNRSVFAGYSGVPFHFYERQILTGISFLDWRDGREPLSDMDGRDLESDWFCVDGRIGAVIAGDTARIRIERRSGFNPARKEEYRDPFMAVAVNPVSVRRCRPGEKLAEVALVVVPGSALAIQACAQGLIDLRDRLPAQWRGLWIPAGQGRRLLALVRFGGQVGSATLKLHSEAGAPVFRSQTVIQGSEAGAEFVLESFETRREEPVFYVELPEDQVLIARQTMERSVELRPAGPAVDAVVRYFGRDQSARILVLNDAGTRMRSERVAGSDFRETGVRIHVAGPTMLKIGPVVQE